MCCEGPATMGGGQLDSAKQNLASSFVNGLVNCAFGRDKLLMSEEKWIYKNKDVGMLSTTASLGWLLLWDVDEGLTQIDKYFYADNEHVKAGALLACGVVNSSVRNECEPALALLTDKVDAEKPFLTRAAAIIAYASLDLSHFFALTFTLCGLFTSLVGYSHTLLRHSLDIHFLYSSNIHTLCTNILPVT